MSPSPLSRGFFFLYLTLDIVRTDFNNATFEGEIVRVVPNNSKDTSPVDHRRWRVFIKSTLKGNRMPTWIQFSTNQEPIPWLISQGRIGAGFKLTVSGHISSVQSPSNHSDGHFMIHLSDAHIFAANIWHNKEIVYTASIAGEYSERDAEVVQF